MKQWLPILLIAFTLLSATAQEQAKDSITYLEEVVIFHPQKKEEPLGITPSSVIREKAFQNFSPIDIPGSINQISGVYVLSGAINTNRITIRGVGARTPFGTDKLRLYFNNIPVTNGTGFSTIEAFDLENLGQMEVVKGPKGTPFGSNLGGAILLQTINPEPGSTALYNNFSAGSYNMVKNNLRFNHRDEKFSIGLHYNLLQTDGYRENNRFERDGLLLNSQWQVAAAHELSVLVNFIDYNAQIPSSLGETAFRENPRQAAFTWAQAQGFEANKYSLFGLGHRFKIGAQSELNTSLFYSYLDHYEPRPFNILEEYTNGYGLRSVLNSGFNYQDRRANFVLGLELYQDDYRWNTYENLYRENDGNGSLQGQQLSANKEFRNQYYFFGNVSLPFTEDFTAQVGLNLNKTDYDYRDLFNQGSENRSARRNFDLIAMPNLDLSYRFGDSNRIYGNLSWGFSNPSLEETLTPDGIINPDIKQETGINYELGSELRLLKNRWWLKLALYRMDIDNLLVAERVGDDQFIGRNAGSTRHQGFEVDTDYAIGLGAGFVLSPFLSYTFSDHKFVSFIDEDEDFSGNPLTGVPRHRVNAGLRLAKDNAFYWNTTYQYVSEIPLTDAADRYSDAYGIINTRIGYNKNFSQRLSLGLNFGVNNLFNTRYAQSVLINAVGFGGAEPRYFYPGNGRNFYGGLNLRLAL